MCRTIQGGERTKKNERKRRQVGKDGPKIQTQMLIEEPDKNDSVKRILPFSTEQLVIFQAGATYISPGAIIYAFEVVKKFSFT